jgi:integrase
VTADSGERQAAPPSWHITVRALLEDEWSQHLKRLGRAATTLETYAIVVSTHLVPGLGNIPLAKLTPRDIDHYYATKAEAGMAPATIRQHGAILSSALSLAVDWDLIPTNPCAKAHLPEKAPSTRNAPSQAQVRKLVDACGDDVDLATAVILAAITGARRGELCGLQWLDVDWDMGILRIERQRVPVTGGDATVPTKTKQVRRIALGEGRHNLDQGSDMAVRAAIGHHGPWPFLWHCALGEPSAAPRERCRHSQGPSGGTASPSFGPASKGRPDRLRASSSQCKEQPGTTAVDGEADRE